MDKISKAVYWLPTIMVMIAPFLAVINVGDAADMLVIPNKTVISPALLKEPIILNGSGWGSNEVVVIDLVLPSGVRVKGVKGNEDVGIAFAKADVNGNFKTTVSPMAILMTFLQVGWIDAEMKPDFKEATPLPPGVYAIQASGLDSQMKAKATLEILPQPKKD